MGSIRAPGAITTNFWPYAENPSAEGVADARNSAVSKP